MTLQPRAAKTSQKAHASDAGASVLSVTRLTPSKAGRKRRTATASIRPPPRTLGVRPGRPSPPVGHDWPERERSNGASGRESHLPVDDAISRAHSPTRRV
jgi:hypothetical protein